MALGRPIPGFIGSFAFADETTKKCSDSTGKCSRRPKFVGIQPSSMGQVNSVIRRVPADLSKLGALTTTLRVHRCRRCFLEWRKSSVGQLHCPLVKSVVPVAIQLSDRFRRTSPYRSNFNVARCLCHPSELGQHAARLKFAARAFCRLCSHIRLNVKSEPNATPDVDFEGQKPLSGSTETFSDGQGRSHRLKFP